MNEIFTYIMQQGNCQQNTNFIDLKKMIVQFKE